MGVKIKVETRNPTVSLSKVIFPKAEAEAGTAESIVSIRATLKNGGKVFEIQPEKVVFTEAAVYDGDEEGWYTVTGTILKWNPEDGTITVRTTGKEKVKTVKVEVYFKGNVVVKKNLSVKAK